MNSPETLSEVYQIFSSLNVFSLLPPDLQQNIMMNMNINHKINIDPNIPIENQVDSPETMSYVSYLYLKYVNTDKDEKNYLCKKFDSNQAKQRKNWFIT